MKMRVQLLLLAVAAAAASLGEARECCGDLIVESEEQVDYLADCTVLYGDLIFNLTGPLAETVSLPLLEEIRGSVKIAQWQDAKVCRLLLPALRKIAGDLTLDPRRKDTVLAEIDLGALEVLRGRLVIDNMAALATLTLPMLSKAYSVEITSAPLLQLDMPALTKLTTLQLAHLASASMDKLYQVGNIIVQDFTDQGRASFAELGHAEEVRISLVTSSFPGLMDADIMSLYKVPINFPTLWTATSVTIQSTDTDFNMPNLRTVGEFYMDFSNPRVVDLSWLSTVTSILSLGTNATNPTIRMNKLAVVEHLQYDQMTVLDLAPLSTLVSAGEVQIQSLPLVTNLDDLSSLVLVQRTVVIMGCDELTNIDGIARDTFTALGKVTIIDNPKLCCSSVVKFAATAHLPGGLETSGCNEAC
eukprot:TRINITY_DN6508_c0_g1_i1.p1 TRINITY_DN6508_c0_g1~~TRINITY_DN6508_c0_g1_i1.p1  ORF type:complete len:416 (-),score=99.64 TRINITY_DN6508_c0_g1_i1:128-1375(-)